jgi:hypothetical protein
VSETETGTGRQAFGLGRPLRDVLDLHDNEQAPTHSLFGGTDDAPTTEALDAAMALGAACLTDDVWGWSSLRAEGGSAVTRLSRNTDLDAAWSLADALRQAAASQQPVVSTDRTAVCIALPAGAGAAVGVRRAGRRLTGREQLVVQAVAGVCVLATGA